MHRECSRTTCRVAALLPCFVSLYSRVQLSASPASTGSFDLRPTPLARAGFTWQGQQARGAGTEQKS